MRILRSACIALSMYTRLPVPQFSWEEEDMRYAICFFPGAGVLAGAALFLWLRAADRLSLPGMTKYIAVILIPVLVTGGIHLDGFMDTSDALQSWGTREKRLEILKDPRIGAFAVIRLITLAGICLAAAACVKARAYGPWAVSLCFSRALSGLAAVRWEKAKKQGTLNSFSAKGAETGASLVLSAEALAFAGLMGFLDPATGIPAVSAGLLVMGYYRYMSRKQFGGITGDLAGWFVCVSEAAMLCAMAAVCVMLPAAAG